MACERPLKKHRILSGSIQKSWLKLAFFQKIVFFANPVLARTWFATMRAKMLNILTNKAEK